MNGDIPVTEEQPQTAVDCGTQYAVSFIGRKANADGVFYPITATISKHPYTQEEAARLELAEHYELAGRPVGRDQDGKPVFLRLERLVEPGEG